jgi:hypothetical protein
MGELQAMWRSAEQERAENNPGDGRKGKVIRNREFGVERKARKRTDKQFFFFSSSVSFVVKLCGKELVIDDCVLFAYLPACTNCPSVFSVFSEAVWKLKVTIIAGQEQ